MSLLTTPKTQQVLGTRSDKGKLPDYPDDHKVGMVVPKGGSNCAKCEYVNGQNCEQRDFVKWLGSKKIPAPTDTYCCDFFEIGDKE